MSDILTSEFFWGVVVGVVLSISGAYFGARFGIQAQNAELRKRQLEFAREIMSGTKTLISELDTHRSRARAIHPDFLDMLDVEIAVYGRNRENLLLLDAAKRKELLEFMRSVALKRAEIQQHLARFHELSNQAAKLSALQEAHLATDKLVELGRYASAP